VATRTAAVEASVSVPLARSLACVAPPAQFGRRRQGVGDRGVEGLTTRLSGRSVLAPPLGYRSRMVSVAVDDPRAAARSLRNHLQPAELMELAVILAEVAANVVGKRTTRQ